MRVLVTGATGAVGAAVVERFQRDGHEVRGLVRGAEQPAGVAIIRGDLTDGPAVAVAARGVDLAVHCAASRSADLAKCQRVNVDGTRCLVEALAVERTPLIHISTVSVYADAAGPSYDEDSALATTPEDAYGFTKAEAERVIRTSNLDAVVLRPAMILSMHPRSRWGPLAVARARLEPGRLVPYPELPYVHVDNLVEAIVIAARAPEARGRAYNVVEGVAGTREYLDAVYGAAGRATPAIPAGAPRLRFAAQRLRRELAWAPRDRWQDFLAELRSPRPT